ncbi:MAG: hypothetical protein CVV44_10135 [Spirochaetae bacterium HGW-Spirochaetae-1]|jgi:hypothetical protein|nr:MAG: hypothetical protein CVV44_10135 [Spirochaetae bacterium HGW-Spirochaetae-1]
MIKKISFLLNDLIDYTAKVIEECNHNINVDQEMQCKNDTAKKKEESPTLHGRRLPLAARNRRTGKRIDRNPIRCVVLITVFPLIHDGQLCN